MRLYYSPSYACDAFDTTRKARWIAESLRQYPFVGVEVCAPVPLAFEDVERMHNGQRPSPKGDGLSLLVK